MRPGVLVVAGLLVACPAIPSLRAQAPTCTKADFEGVVDDAAGALRDLGRQNTPQFQARLRQLKEKRGWSDDRFLKEAEPLVRDEKITAFDRQSEEFLARITSAGQTAAAPDCALLTELRATMQVLVDTQKAKWAYMFEKIEGELRK